MRLRELARIGLTAVVCLGAGLASAAELSVGPGSSFSLGSGRLDLGCADLTVGGTLSGGTGTLDQARDVSIQNGTLNGDSATLNVTGDWSNSGIFNASTSTVNFVDGCGRSSATVSGDSSFFDLDVTTSSGKLVAFAAGSTTTVTDSLALAGVPGQGFLQIRSTLDGSEAYLDLQGSQSVSFVEVKDNHAIGNEIYYGPDSSSLGNTDGWVFLGIPVPALGAGGLALLTALLMVASAVALKRRSAAG